MDNDSGSNQSDNCRVSSELERIARKIGYGAYALSFGIELDNGRTLLKPDDFNLTPFEKEDGTVVFAGSLEGMSIEWTFTPVDEGYTVGLCVESSQSLGCRAINSLVLKYKPGSGDLSDWRFLFNGISMYEDIGLPKVAALSDKGVTSSLLGGVFPDSRGIGLFMGTLIPQSKLHHYLVRRTEDGAVEFTCSTRLTHGLGKQQKLCSETTWVCARKDVKSSIETFSSFTPPLAKICKPVTGWNTWDYYWFTIKLSDIAENIDAIKKDDVLSNRIEYIVVDAGWEHSDGEWNANYKFPGGPEQIAGAIRSMGCIPGIWTAPVLVHANSVTALKNPGLLVKDEYGDPQRAGTGGMYVLDPTHPEGREFLKELFTTLFNAGFRLFKVDFVHELLTCKRFYDELKGPYDAIRDLFSIIRECVTQKSHILGCGLPPECGPGIADSGRVGIDIHNHWSHVTWAVEFLSASYWMHNRIWVNDPDFLVVRGKYTSLEAETNVLNPYKNRPNPPRWRSGPVFTLDEAKTWASIVALSGGNVFLSDRIDMLNDDGKKLLYKVMQPSGAAAVPLDLCDGEHPSLWLQELSNGYRLTIINWMDEKAETGFKFSEYGLDAPLAVADFWTGETLHIKDGIFKTGLETHQCTVICWTKKECEP